MNKTNLLFLVIFLPLLICSCSPEEEIAPDDRPLGVSARSFLSDEKFASLSVEIVHVIGHEPSESTLESLAVFLQKYLNKPEGITIRTRAIISPDRGTYSLSEIKEIETLHRTAFTSGRKLAAYIFIADDKSESSDGGHLTLGKAYKNTSMVIYNKAIRELARNYGSLSSNGIQATTIRHEFGHLFGLVNNGTPAQSPHEDSNPKSTAHCSVTGCLMNASLQFRAFTVDDNGNQDPYMDFDPKCHQDLIANGGK